jgi:hypothetical protein
MTMTDTEFENYHTLINDCQTLSLEAFSLNDVKKAIQNTLPRVSAGFMNTLTYLTRWDYSAPETLRQSALNLKAKQLDYLEMDDVMVPVPLGLIKTYPVYLNHTQQITLEEMIELNTIYLPAVTGFLSGYIHEPELFNERFVKTPTLGSNNLLEERSRTEATFFVMGNRISDRSYTDVFNSNAEMAQAVKTLNETNRERWTRANPKEVATKVKTLSVIATTLLNNIQTMETAPSREHITAIANALELTARHVEWYASATARLLETTAAMKRMEQKLLRL